MIHKLWVIAYESYKILKIFCSVPSKNTGYYHVAGYNFKNAQKGELSKSLGHSIQMYEYYLSQEIVHEFTTQDLYLCPMWDPLYRISYTVKPKPLRLYRILYSGQSLTVNGSWTLCKISREMTSICNYKILTMKILRKWQNSWKFLEVILNVNTHSCLWVTSVHIIFQWMDCATVHIGTFIFTDHLSVII